jgi:hypothetical protein
MKPWAEDGMTHLEMLLNNGVATTLLSVFLGGLITWFAAWIYYKKAGDELKKETELLRKGNMAIIYMLEHPDAAVEVRRDDVGNPVGLIVSAGGHAGAKIAAKGVLSDVNKESSQVD